MKYPFAFLVCFILFFNLPAFAQEEVEFLMKNYRIEEGLPENTVLDIVEDEIGFLWIASPNFLTRFNGEDFKVFRKSFDHQVDESNFKLGKLYVQEDRLWMIVKGGRLEYMDLKTEEFHHITHLRDKEEEIVNLKSFFFEPNRIYLGTVDRGLFIVDKDFKLISHYHEASKQALSSNTVNHIFKWKDQSLWVLTEGGVNKISLGIVNHYIEDLNFTHGIGSANGILHFSTASGGIWNKFQATDSIYYFFDRYKFLKDALKKIRIPMIYYQRKYSSYVWGHWIATLGDGLKVIDERIKYAVNVRLDNEPKDIYCIYGSKSGKIWVGTRKFGLYSLDPTIPMETIGLPKELDPDQRLSFNVAEGQDFFSVSQNKEIFIYEEDLTLRDRVKAFDLFKAGESFEVDWVIPIQGMGRFLISSTNQGSLIFNPKNQEIQTLGKSIDQSLSKFEVSEGGTLIQENKKFPGKLLLGNELGLFILDTKDQVFSQVSDQKVAHLSAINSQELAIHFSNGDIGIYDFLTDQLDQRDFLKGIIPADLDIQTIKYQNDWLWLGSLGNGLFTVNLKNGTLINLWSENGLPNDFIMGMEFSDSRTLWCSTNNGFFRLNFIKENGVIGIEEVLYLNYKNGISINEFLPNFSYKPDERKICFGSDQGVLCLEGQNYYWDEYQPKIVLSELKVNSQEVESLAGIHYLDDLELKSFENSLEFFFTAISKNVPDNLSYSYQLEGYDKGWVRAGNRRYVSYTNLDPGAYTFKVKLADDNFDGAPVKSFSIIIHKAFWQTLWFKLLVMVLLVSIFYFLYRLKINHLMKVQRVKEEISADLHDDLGARLTTIHLLSAINKNKFKNQPEVEKLLLSIDQEIQDSSEALHELVGNIKMKEDDLEGYFSKLRRYASESLDQSNLSYRISCPDHASQLKLSLAKRKDIYLILKELINNIRKHSKANEVNISITVKQEFLLIRVVDNGLGFEPNTLSDRNGLQILKYRVDKYKGIISINSSLGKGTRVMISIPLDKTHAIKNFWFNSLQKVARLWTFN